MLGIQTRAAGRKAQTNPLSYSGTPRSEQCLVILNCKSQGAIKVTDLDQGDNKDVTVVKAIKFNGLNLTEILLELI